MKKILFIALVLFISIILTGCGQSSSQEELSYGLTKLDNKDYQWALQNFDKAIELDATNASAYVFKMSTKFKLKDYQGVINDFDIAIEIETPDTAEYYYPALYSRRGQAKIWLQDYKWWCEDLENAFSLQRIKSSILIDLIDTYCK